MKIVDICSGHYSAKINLSRRANCMANCPNAPFSRDETGFIYLEPGESKIFRTKISVKEGDWR